jgi:hypothetical protein
MGDQTVLPIHLQQPSVGKEVDQMQKSSRHMEFEKAR